ncbi:MAG TPA: hypothetical protein VNT26_02745, partial [Candidatus Sulfotelmatobacter sp.]|nr:hypothetical protein [Candidatus Sulfotelmatobacter sp.]
VSTARPVYAEHLSGGTNDLMGLYGGISLLLGFGGLLGLLGLGPKRWRKLGFRLGRWLLAAGAAVLAAGGYQVAVRAKVEQVLGGEAYGRMAAQQIAGTLGAFVLFWGGVYFLARRTGVLNMGESVKYLVLRNGDPAERTATRAPEPGDQRLMWIPFAAMGVLALFFTAGVLIVLYRLSSAKV